MRKSDLEILKKPYSSDAENIHDRIHSALQADTPSSIRLADEIFNDLDFVSFGVSWWPPMDTAKRILISDYLYSCADAIQTNITEARIHLMEWRHAREEIGRRFKDCVSRAPDGGLILKHPPAESPMDDLWGRLEDLHLCGFFRAIGSAMDCLGSAIVGVVGLPRSLRRADLRSAEKGLDAIMAPNSPCEQVQIDFRNFYKNAVNSAGPQDWLEYADQYRNMFVHRGRRFTYSQLTRLDGPVLYDQNHQVILRTDATIHLAKHPDCSDVEAFVKTPKAVLNEDAEKTLNGLFDSARDLVEMVCEELVRLWTVRRSEPTLISQPENQWKPGDLRSDNFTGYDSNAEPLGATAIMGNPKMKRRMLSASVDDAHRSFWSNYQF